jgi:hypothetical protein
MKDAFLNFMDAAPNDAKNLVKEAIRGNTKVLKYAHANYNMNELAQVLLPNEHEKVASEEEDTRQKVFVVDKTMPHDKLIKLCDEVPGLARNLNRSGVSILDLRDPSDIVNKVKHYEDFKFFDTPNEGGLYLVYMRTGEAKKAAVFPKVETNAHKENPSLAATPEVDKRERADMFCQWAQPDQNRYKTLVVFRDGSYCYTNHLISNKLGASVASVVDFLGPIMELKPKVGDRGIWITKWGGGYESTPCVTIDAIYSKGSTTRYSVFGWNGVDMVSQSMSSDLTSPHVQSHSKTVIMPSTAKFFKVTDMVPSNKLVTKFEELSNFVKESSDGYSISKNGGFYKLDNGEEFTYHDFIAKTAEDLNVSCGDIDALVNYLDKSAADSVEFLLEKNAQPVAQPAAKPQPKPKPEGDSSQSLQQIITGQQKIINQLLKERGQIAPPSPGVEGAGAAPDAGQPAPAQPQAPESGAD